MQDTGEAPALLCLPASCLGLEGAGQPEALGQARATAAVCQSWSQLLVHPVFPVIPLLWASVDRMLQMSLTTLATPRG